MTQPGRIIHRTDERIERRPDEEFFAPIDEPGDVAPEEQFQLFEGIGETRAERLAGRFDSIADFTRASRPEQAVPGVSEETAGVLDREAAKRGIRRSDFANVIGPPTDRTDILRTKTNGRYMARPPQPAPDSPGWRNQNGRYVGYEIADPGLRRRTDNGQIYRATGDTKLPLSAQRKMFGDPDGELDPAPRPIDTGRGPEQVREIDGERVYAADVADRVPDTTPPGTAPGDFAEPFSGPLGLAGAAESDDVMGWVPSASRLPADAWEGLAEGTEADQAFIEAEERRGQALGGPDSPLTAIDSPLRAD